eukprot:CAMPEP_0172377316 /NCGR_PEP_ID=MMETSP1060-20121228/68841_1 /TAXON_ID=37318 /ORGANISM="Pseudo-nitzschia pungens, Strain cf. cingulata" /LENGTH=263 /DNA_ID=CAMNT_0013104997 /DNA_START=184 /DNA_END=972 /DNA_ORIENTATION=+
MDDSTGRTLLFVASIDYSFPIDSFLSRVSACAYATDSNAIGWLAWFCPSVRRSVVIVVLAQRQFQFPLELLDLESVAPQHLVSLVDVFDFGEELLEALNGGVYRLPGLLRVVLEVDGSDRVLDVVDAEACLHEQILELVQPGLDLLAVREDDDDEEESPEKNRLGPTPILGLTLTLAVERNHCGVFHPASVPIDRVAPVAHCAVAVVLLVAAAAERKVGWAIAQQQRSSRGTGGEAEAHGGTGSGTAMELSMNGTVQDMEFEW